MRFSVSRHDVRIQVLVATFDEADTPFAATWRAVGVVMLVAPFR